MNHINKFSNFKSPKVNEEFFGLSKEERTQKRMDNIQISLDRYLPVWIRKAAIKMPNKNILDKFWEDAKNDDYLSGDIIGGSGAVGIKSDTKELVYRNFSELKTKGPNLEGIS